MAQAARKVTAKNANEKLANPRLTVPERLGNVAEACRGAMHPPSLPVVTSARPTGAAPAGPAASPPPPADSARRCNYFLRELRLT